MLVWRNDKLVSPSESHLITRHSALSPVKTPVPCLPSSTIDILTLNDSEHLETDLRVPYLGSSDRTDRDAITACDRRHPDRRDDGGHRNSPGREHEGERAGI